MASKVVVEGSTVSASQLKDFFRQIEEGSITSSVMQAILEHRNPFVPTGTFKYDQQGPGLVLLENRPRRINGPIEAVFLNFGGSLVKGEAVAERAVALGANYGQEDAEWLLEHQEMIPVSLRNYHLVFPGTKWGGTTGVLGMPCLSFKALHWRLFFVRLDDNFKDDFCLVRPWSK